MKNRIIAAFALALALCCVPCLAFADEGGSEGTLITEVDLIVTPCETGRNPDFTWEIQTKPEAGADIVNSSKPVEFEWRCYTALPNSQGTSGWMEMTESDVFQENRAYAVMLSFALAEGYCISETETTLLVNGGPASTGYQPTSNDDQPIYFDTFGPASFVNEEYGYVGIVCRWGTPTPIRAIDLSVTEPVAGQSPEFVMGSEGEDPTPKWSVATEPENALNRATLDIEPVWLHRVADERRYELMGPEDTFEPWETYVFGIGFYPTDEYCIPVQDPEYLPEWSEVPPYPVQFLINGEPASSEWCSGNETSVYINIEWTIPCDHANLAAVPEKAATCVEPGNEAYWKCPDCGKYFSDAAATVEIEENSWIIPVLEKTDLSDCKVTLAHTVFFYNGKTKNPAVTVLGVDGTKLKNGTDYIVIYAKGRKYVGTHQVTIKGKGNYTGSIVKPFKVKPKATAVKSLAKAKKSFKVTWAKRTTQVTGYQVRYKLSTAKTWKTVTISKNTTTSKTVKNLKVKKKYNVQVRTYKTVNGVKYYSTWTTKKTVTTK